MVANKAGSERPIGHFRLNWQDTVNQRDTALNGRAGRRDMRGSRNMQFHVIKAGAARKPTACAIVGIHENAAMSESARRVDRASGGAISRVLKRGDFAGRSMETFPIVGVRRGPAERILLVGLGSRSGFGRKPYRRAIYAATQWLAKSGAGNAVSWLASDGVPGLDALLRRAPRRREREQRALPDSRPQDGEEAAAPEALKVRHRRGGCGCGACRSRRERRARHFGRHGAHEGSREPARERLHAFLPRRCREVACQGTQGHQRKSAHPPRDQGARHGLVPVGHPRLGRAAAPDRARIPRRQEGRCAGRARRQGHHLRHRRHLPQAATGHGRDEVRHVAAPPPCSAPSRRSRRSARR